MAASLAREDNAMGARRTRPQATNHSTSESTAANPSETPHPLVKASRTPAGHSAVQDAVSDVAPDVAAAVIQTALSVGAARRDVLVRLREALEVGESEVALKLASQLVGLD